MSSFKKTMVIFLGCFLMLNLCSYKEINAKAAIEDSQEIVTYSKMFLGLPYMRGGTTPNGFDCSGFVQYVYAHFGIDLPRTTGDQVNTGVKVNREELKPGDIVFFGTQDNVYHDGIYIGGGRFIHSSKPGDVIRIEYLKYMQYYSAVRVANN